MLCGWTALWTQMPMLGLHQLSQEVGAHVGGIGQRGGQLIGHKENGNAGEYGLRARIVPFFQPLNAYLYLSLLLTRVDYHESYYF